MQPSKKKKKSSFPDLESYPTYNLSAGLGNPNEWRKIFSERFSSEQIDSILGGKDPYQILGVTKGTAMSEIRTSYRKLCLQYHPDKNPTQDTKEQFQRINAAWQKINQ